MYKEHPVFIQPDNENIKIWRYMDFTKFMSLVDTKKLFFTRPDKFEDPFEGSWPKINVAAREFAPDDLEGESRDAYLKAMKVLGEHNKGWLRFNAVNCWHANEYESAAMWKLYLKSDEGIAIQSTYKRLKESILSEDDVFIGKVKYIDYETEFIDANNQYGSLIHKRKSFEHEKEVRAVITKWPKLSDDKINFKNAPDTIKGGIPVKMDIENLVEKIYIAPNSPEWFADLLTAIIKKYGYNFEIIHSKMNESPLF